MSDQRMSRISEPLTIPVATISMIVGREIESHVGPVFRLIVRSAGTAHNIAGTFRAFRRGEVKEYTGTFEDARHTALERMVEHAISLGADAAVGLRFDSGNLGESQGMAEIVAYGTSVKLC